MSRLSRTVLAALWAAGLLACPGERDASPADTTARIGACQEVDVGVCVCDAGSASQVVVSGPRSDWTGMGGGAFVSRRELGDEDDLKIDFGGDRVARLTFTHPGGIRRRLSTTVGAVDVTVSAAPNGLVVSGDRTEHGGEKEAWTVSVSPQPKDRPQRAWVLRATHPGFRLPRSNAYDASSPRPALPMCRCGEHEDVTRRPDGSPRESTCTTAAGVMRVRVDYDERGFPSRIDELRETAEPATLPPVMTTFVAPREARSLPATTRTLVLRWSASGYLRAAHVELDRRRYGWSVAVAEDGAVRLGGYDDDQAVGIWLDVDSHGEVSAMDRGPRGAEARRLEVDGLPGP